MVSCKFSLKPIQWKFGGFDDPIPVENGAISGPGEVCYVLLEHPQFKMVNAEERKRGRCDLWVPLEDVDMAMDQYL